MKLPEFAYEKPRQLADALSLMADSRQDVRILAGGQSLLPALNFRLGDPDLLIDINGIDELTIIDETADALRIGALARHADVQRHELINQQLPLIARAIENIAHPAIRNRGTLGGSIALADPAAELPACLLAYKATVVAQSASGIRRISADDFFVGLYETALNAGEIITSIEFGNDARGNQRHGFYEISRRHGDFAVAGAAVCAGIDGPDSIRIVLFGISDRPVRALAAETVLDKQPLDATTIAAAADLAPDGIEVFADVHASIPMKRQLARVVTARALTTLSMSLSTPSS